MNFNKEKIIELSKELSSRQLPHVVHRDNTIIGIRAINNSGITIVHDGERFICNLYRLAKSDKKILDLLNPKTIPQEIRDRIEQILLVYKTQDEIIDYLEKTKIILN